MIRKLFKGLGLLKKTVSEKIDDSTEFLDKTLDQEYITSSIDKAKEMSGQLVEKAGETFETVKQSAKEALDNPEISAVTDKITDYGKDLKAKGQALADKALEHEIVRDTVEEMKDTAKNLGKTIEDKVDQIKTSLDITDEEE